MPKIVTLTLNPTIDASYEIGQLAHTKKMRCHGERYDPGGGGINVARVLGHLGTDACCYYLSGGAMGAALDQLLGQMNLARQRIAISGNVRVASTVFEKASGKEYRVVPAGPSITANEWADCLAQLEAADCDYIVASGSLPRGVPDDFYGRIAAMAARKGTRVVIDSSGPALAQAVAAGGVFMIKPNLIELESLVGVKLPDKSAITKAASGIVTQGGAEYVVVTMAQDGALLASKTGTLYCPAIPVIAKSAVGAGDSFVAGMVHALAAGSGPEDAFHFGIAAGTAAVLTAGTELCLPEDVHRFYAQMASPAL